MTNAIRMIFAGCMLLVSICIPIKMIGQKLAISGDGQLRVIPSLYGEGLVIYDNMLPHYKPMTKSVIIKRYDLRADQGELKRDYTHVGRQGFWRTMVSYDRQGNVVEVEVNGEKISLQYVNNKIVEINYDRQPNYKFSYGSKGHLESAVSEKYTYKYNVDTRGDITSVKEYFGVKMSSTAISMSYDNQHRMTAYHEVGDFFGTPYSCDYRWVYDKKGNLASYKRIYHKNGRKTEDLEYRFEYDTIGNPTRCIRYRHGDITIIDGGYEYEYDYSFYLSPEEERRQDSILQVEEMWRKAQEAERQRIASLKSSFSSCRFLFDSEEDFEASIAEEADFEAKIIELLDNKIDEISQNVKTGRELRQHNQSSRDMWYICNIRVSSQRISTYRENRLMEFVSERKVLSRKYKNDFLDESYYLFLKDYIYQARREDGENPYHSDYYRLVE